MQRKDAILLAATEHFGRFGFRGASLRDIARDAGVSLTLLNHHFGSKASLLSAAVDAHRRCLDERVSALHAVQNAGSGRWGVRDLIQAWLRADLVTASTLDGRLFLQLAARISDDTSHEFDADVQARLDRAAPVFVDMLVRCRPDASRRAAESAFLWAGAAMNRFLVGAAGPLDKALSEASEAVDAEDEARLVEFLTAGVEAALAVRISAPASPADALQPAQESALAA